MVLLRLPGLGVKLIPVLELVVLELGLVVFGVRLVLVSGVEPGLEELVGLGGLGLKAGLSFGPGLGLRPGIGFWPGLGFSLGLVLSPVVVFVLVHAGLELVVVVHELRLVKLEALVGLGGLDLSLGLMACLAWLGLCFWTGLFLGLVVVFDELVVVWFVLVVILGLVLAVL